MSPTLIVRQSQAPAVPAAAAIVAVALAFLIYVLVIVSWMQPSSTLCLRIHPRSLPGLLTFGKNAGIGKSLTEETTMRYGLFIFTSQMTSSSTTG